MKFLACTEYQKKELGFIYPKVSDYLALIPSHEYFYWQNKFDDLYDDLCGHLHAVRNAMALFSTLPVLQCVTKLSGINRDKFLIPRVFKFATLPEGMRDFGISQHAAAMLDIISNTVPFPFRKFPNTFPYSTSTKYLGFLAWDQSMPTSCIGDRYLPLIHPCASKVHDIKVLNNDLLLFNDIEYEYLLPTSNYYMDDEFQELLGRLNDRKMLALPLMFPLTNLKNLIGFTNPSWAEVKPLDFFLDEPPENASNFLLIRTDDGKIHSWDEVQSNPRLRLELEMSDYWLWQHACPTTPALEHINLYWTFGHDYPWLIDKRDGSWIPALVIDM